MWARKLLLGSAVGMFRHLFTCTELWALCEISLSCLKRVRKTFSSGAVQMPKEAWRRGLQEQLIGNGELMLQGMEQFMFEL